MIKHYNDLYKVEPDDYAICSYDATMALIAAIDKVVTAKKPLTRKAVLAALSTISVSTPQGEVSFDEYGDLKTKVISVFQAHKNPAVPLDDDAHQFKYLGVAPQS
jgi:branched-chain amino acid transport system substrate-binding protein